jgi:hypothetical protein
MAKTGPLGKLEKFYIDGNHESMGVDELAKEMDRSKSAVNNYIKKIKAVDAEAKAKEYNIGEPLPTNNNPVVMTEGQSQLGDLIHQKGKTISTRMAGCITSSKKK